MKVQEAQEAPVPIQLHYETLKSVENAILEELSANESSWSLVGASVMYSLAGDDGLPVGEEYRLDCGYLEPANLVPYREITEEEWLAMVEEGTEPNGLTLEFIDGLYSIAKGMLTSGSAQALAVGVAGVLAGNSYYTFTNGCYCVGPKLRRVINGQKFCGSAC